MMAAFICIALYAGQIGMGRWQSDEFALFTNQRLLGWHALLPRLAYAPRPFSEGLLFLYGEAVLGFDRPLIAPFLAVLWFGSLGSTILAAYSVLPPSNFRLQTALALAGTMFAFVLATTRVTEVFYWPVGAVAYLPTTGAAGVLLFLLSTPLNRRRRLGCCAALLVAATSSEVGAVFAIGFAGAAAIEAALRLRMDARLRPPLSAALGDGIWWILPGLFGLVAMGFILFIRARVVELGSDTQPYTGHLGASISVALRHLALDLVSNDEAEGRPRAILIALSAKCLFAAGFAAVWRQADHAGGGPGRWHAVLAASLGGAAFFSIAGAYFHYGVLCCERHSTARQWLIDVLVVLAMTWALAQWQPARRFYNRSQWRACLPPMLLMSSLFPLVLRADGLRTDYQYRHLAISARARTWYSGRQTDTDTMEFYLSPDRIEMLVHGTSHPIGVFHVGRDSPEMVTEVGRFFGKDVVAVCQPWQIKQSVLINGTFFPACPPHDGPPDIVVPADP